MNAKRVIAILIACLVVVANIMLFSEELTGVFRGLLFSKFSAGNLLSGKNASSGIETTILSEGDANSKVAVISLDDTIGAVTKEDYITRSLNNINANSDVKGVIIRIDSLKSGVNQSANFFDKIRDFKTTKQIPVYAVIGSSATASGYCVASSCDRIYVNENTIINYTKLYDADDTEIGIMDRTLTSDGRNNLQLILSNGYEEFLKRVIENRQIDETTIRTLTDGRVYEGIQAYELRLVDSIGNFDDALRDMNSQLGLSNPQVLSYNSYKISKNDVSIKNVIANNLTTHIISMIPWGYAV